MPVAAAKALRSEREARKTLRRRLEERRVEIEQAFLARICAISDPDEVADPEYAGGLRAAVAAALDFGLAGMESGEGELPLPPVALLAQARLAARNGVSLDTVLRRYFACYSLLVDYVIEESERGAPLPGRQLKHQLRVGAAVFDRLIQAITEEHVREVSARRGSSEEVRADQVIRLLGGQPLDTTDLSYDLDCYHLGLVAEGESAGEGVRELAASLGCRLLVVARPDGRAWAWLGARRRPDAAHVHSRLSSDWRSRGRLAIGELGQGLDGWRRTHRQAQAALSVALRGGKRLVRYADVALLASALRDDLLTRSLHDLYLAPLARERDGGAVARATLHAYFATDGNVSSAAAMLGVSRPTVSNRLRQIEELLAQPVKRRMCDLEMALRLEQLQHRGGAGSNELPQ